MVPFPRLHFLTPSMAGIYSDKSEPGASLYELGQKAVAAKNFQVNVLNFDPLEDKYMALNLQFRGTEKVREAREVVNRLKGGGEVSFVEWMPTGAKMGCRKNPIGEVKGEAIKAAERTVTMLGNNVAINRTFTRTCKKYDMMYSQRAYVHWFTGEGMQEGEFSEAREDLGFLEKDYLDVLTEQAGDEDEDDEEF